MADFRTSLSLSPALSPIRHQDKLLSIGSCFAENIGQRLADAKFQLLMNPFGIVYNPISVRDSLLYLIDNKEFTKEDVFYHQERWHSFAHHSRFSDAEQSTCLKSINSTTNKGHKHLLESDVLILTFGTAHVFYHKKMERIVNNCHQLPADTFERQLLSVDDITTQLSTTLERIKTLRPNIRIILTVSPVRHIRDGLVESRLSKSILRVAVHELCNAFNHMSYFPAYELIMDDLRDYRFYNADMLHPNEVAVEYVWQRFGEVYFDETTKQLIKRIEKLKKAMQHRPFQSDSERHRTFLTQHLNQTRELQQTYPFLNFDKELDYFK